MKVVRDLSRWPCPAQGCALTIGNFDGLHRGHQAMIKRLNQQAQGSGLTSVLMTFEPMPLELFCPHTAPVRLSSRREKMEDARAFGIDAFVRLRFDRAFAALDAQAFMQTLLVEQLGVRYVIVGEDFHFAREQEGNVQRLIAFGAEHDFTVEPMPAVMLDGERISSTRVRAALAAGDVARARRLLGRDYRMSGRVVRGRQLGRTLGFPTANLRMQHRVAPRYGVYAVRVQLANGRQLYGAASLGVRPTVAGRDCLLEVFLLDFSGDLYGQRIDVWFESFIRPEVSFDGLAALTQQMHADVTAIRAVFERA